VKLGAKRRRQFSITRAVITCSSANLNAITRTYTRRTNTKHHPPNSGAHPNIEIHVARHCVLIGAADGFAHAAAAPHSPTSTFQLDQQVNQKFKVCVKIMCFFGNSKKKWIFFY
jgi:hypothetical protein